MPSLRIPPPGFGISTRLHHARLVAPREQLLANRRPVLLADRRAIRPPSSHRCPDCPCSASRASAPPQIPSLDDALHQMRTHRFLSARFPAPPSSLHRSALLSGLHPSPPAAAPAARWTSGAWPCRDARSFRSPLRLALRIEAVHPPRSPSLLRPLLTSRSAASCDSRRPFGREARSPQVRLIDCPCTSAGSTDRLLGRESFAVICPLALLAPPHIRFLFVAPQVSLPASFSESLTIPRLAVRSGRCDQLPRGLSPPSRWSCWAHKKRKPARTPAFFFTCYPAD